ncbi:helix-turn-helix domain-containing protein [Paenibacillus hamazuiensis]|uniref:helix-turn-helix domain-containing protein n=1 Tax=Paenibacillus hamazuiensis TaxID=2936508 RepID=UPI00200DF49C|nr:helix-turn-helix domain-containing protein [Paenibacillus hamazuiensis]
MKKTWRNRLLLSYLPVLFITISMLVFISVSIISEISVHETEKANRIFTEYVSDSMQNSLRNIEHLVLEGVNSNPAYADFFEMAGGENQLLVNYLVSREIGKLIEENPLIHSIYLYRSADKIVLSKSLYSRLTEFEDNAFLQEALSKPASAMWSPVRKYAEFSSEPKVGVISMTKKALLPFGNQGIIVVNVKVDALLQFVHESINPDITFLEIQTADRETVYPLPEAAAARPADNKHQGKVVTRLHSDYIGWDFISGVYGGVLFSWVTVISRIWIGIGVLTVLISLIFTFVLTRRNYKPVEDIVQQINAYGKNQLKGGGSDEFSYIRKVLDNLFQEKNVYEKRRMEDLPAKRKQAFLELIHGQGHADDSVWKARMAEFHLPDDFSCLTATVVEIDHYERFKESYSLQDQHLLKYALANVSKEFSGGRIWEEWISGSRLAILYLDNAASSSDLETRAADMLEHLRVWVALNLKFSVTIGVGRPAAGVREVSASFEEAVEALQFKMSLGSNQLISFKELEEERPRDTRVYFQLFDAMLQDLRMGSASFPGRLSSFAQYLEQDVLPQEVVDHLLQYWINIVERSMLEAEPALGEYWRTAVHPELTAAAERAETLEDLLPAFVSAFEKLHAKQVSLQESKSYHHLIREIRAYIEENYANPDLSLNHISDKFSINGKYSSQLFKEHFGMKFVDFLVNLRMDHAKKLLHETEEPIQDIALKVGYLHSISFGRTFKKVVGVTPGDYRKYRQLAPEEEH